MESGPSFCPQQAEHRPVRGWTLVELLVVVAITGIVMTIALPAYQSHLSKARRTDARTALLDLAGRQERYYTLHHRFAADGASLGYTSGWPLAIPAGAQALYAVSVTATTSGGGNYTATATPLGPQAGDACGTFMVNELGQTLNQGATLNSIDCWR